MRLLACIASLVLFSSLHSYIINDYSICGQGPGGVFYNNDLNYINETDASGRQQPKVVGGSVVQNRSYPWHVAIYLNSFGGSEFVCGGSLINRQFVLTAAHCKMSEFTGLFPDQNMFSVGIGHNVESQTRRIGIQEFRTHPGFNTETIENDLGLIRLSEVIDFNDRVKPICLATAQMNRDFGSETQATIIGWGLKQHRGEPSQTLLDVKVPCVRLGECRAKYGKRPRDNINIYDSMICAGQGGKSACQGDSGGSLTIPWLVNKEVRYFQHGIVSFGKVCGHADNPTVFTRIYEPHLYWIVQTMNSMLYD